MCRAAASETKEESAIPARSLRAPPWAKPAPFSASRRALPGFVKPHQISRYPVHYGIIEAPRQELARSDKHPRERSSRQLARTRAPPYFCGKRCRDICRCHLRATRREPCRAAAARCPGGASPGGRQGDRANRAARHAPRARSPQADPPPAPSSSSTARARPCFSTSKKKPSSARTAPTPPSTPMSLPR